MKRVLVDVDTQFDFVDPRGALYVPADATVSSLIGELLQQAEADGDPIIGSVDSHAWDAWEFTDNGGPFAAHCVKGQAGWLRVNADRPTRTRFVPMQVLSDGAVVNLVGEREQGTGPRQQSADALVDEALSSVGIYFEKEVYSLFSNPTAAPFVEALVQRMGGRDAVTFDVIGYCTGGYCVDAAALGLAERGYRVRVVAAATAAIGGASAGEQSRQRLGAKGIAWHGA